MNSADRAAVQSRIGYSFNNEKLLDAAFTHSSYINEHNAVCNERIEFLGDCVLNFSVGERLFFGDRTASEGALSARRAALVSRAPLARIVDGLGLIEFLRVGAGETSRRFRQKRGPIFSKRYWAPCISTADSTHVNKCSTSFFIPTSSPNATIKANCRSMRRSVRLRPCIPWKLAIRGIKRR